MYEDRHALCFKNKVLISKYDDDYWIVAFNGNVYTSNYTCTYVEHKMLPCDTFKVGACRQESYTEERKLLYLSRLENIIDTFLIMEHKIYADIDRQLEEKLGEL